MQTKDLTAVLMIFALAAAFATASQANDCLEGCSSTPPSSTDDGGGDPEPKGNNGWGNGDEGTNAGSDEGGTEDTKSDESRDEGDTSPGPDKFTTR